MAQKHEKRGPQAALLLSYLYIYYTNSEWVDVTRLLDLFPAENHRVAGKRAI
jgi:hypothetical protein